MRGNDELYVFLQDPVRGHTSGGQKWKHNAGLRPDRARENPIVNRLGKVGKNPFRALPYESCTRGRFELIPFQQNYPEYSTPSGTGANWGIMFPVSQSGALYSTLRTYGKVQFSFSKPLITYIHYG